MRLPTLLLCVLVLVAAPARAADDSFHGALGRGAAVHPSQYSFSDLYRLAVSGGGATLALGPAGEAPMRAATAQPAGQFSVSERGEPRLGLLILSGIALALWVARRRMGYAL